MFSFLQSLFRSVSSPSREISPYHGRTSSRGRTNSVSSSESDVEEVTAHGQPLPSRGRRSSLPSKLSPDKGRGSPRLASTDAPPSNDTSSKLQGNSQLDFLDLTGALYKVDGLDFECLMSECEVDLDGRLLVITPVKRAIHKGMVAPKEGHNALTKRLFLRVERIRHLRQHLPDAFQFIAKTGEGENEVEYGLQLDSEALALQLRHALFPALLDTCRQPALVAVECALAKYDTKAKEFVIASTSSICEILQRPSDLSAFLAISSSGDTASVNYFIIESLNRELQVWPSPSTNQITFWGLDYRSASVDKAMWLMEMNPNQSNADLIKKFFFTLASIIKEKAATADTKEAGLKSIDEGTDESGSDSQFDLGDLGDVETKRTWRRGSISASRERRRRSAFGIEDDVHSLRRRREPEEEYSKEEVSASSDESGDEEAQEAGASYIPYQEPKYSASGTLTHRFMEVGTDRTFVCRGDPAQSYYNLRSKEGKRVVSVYKQSDPNVRDEDQLETVGSISGDKFKYNGARFAPDKGLLHQQESKLLVVPEDSWDGEVYMMDLTKEKVVQKWDARNTPIKTLFPTFKEGSSSQDPTFLCANPRNLFLMDTRMSGGSAKSTDISYKTDPQFTVGATDSDGHIVMASRNGELRLYDGEANAAGNFKRAKTLLQTIKEPITAVDVTRDGAWIVATTKTFLIVVCTRLLGTGRTGFETALGQAKPKPRFLMLKAEDVVKYQITDISFAPAKFDAQEDCIVSSTGNMAVVWDFGMVKRGTPFYSIRFADDAIKDVQIGSDINASVVVAYPTSVGLFGTEKRRVDQPL